MFVYVYVYVHGYTQSHIKPLCVLSCSPEFGGIEPENPQTLNPSPKP